MRPNIRVEIQNNLVEPMEVEENEEGEISDGEDKESVEKEPLRSPFINKMSSPTFVTGDLDLLSKSEQEKLQERARRFHLDPDEIRNFTDEDLKLLHASLGINPQNEANVRFEVIHMRGTDRLKAPDILEYFLEYAPLSVEWIDEECCNVVWPDRLSTYRALHFMSKPVRGMPVRDDSSYFDNLQEETDQSVLLANKNREIQLQDHLENVFNKLFNEKNSADIYEITTTIPPGYWRLGKKYKDRASFLLRFSLKTDKKPFKVEQFSKYYKGQGKIHSRVLPESKTQGIFGRNKDMHGKVSNEKNPWTVLAKNWDEDAPFREKERSLRNDEPKIEIKNPSLKVRLGSKRKEQDDEEPQEKLKKIKIPRMRMYADEEEEKIRRKKMLKRIDHQIKKLDQNVTDSSDLRSVLNMSSRTNKIKHEPLEPEAFDLGSTLRNRNRKMVFEIKREEDDRDTRRRSERHRRRSEDEEEEEIGRDKPQSKVAVVIRTQKRPTVASAVASTVWSRVGKGGESESESEEVDSSSESDSTSSEESEDEREVVRSRVTNRPGFNMQERSGKTFRSPLKIEINNDHFKKH